MMGFLGDLGCGILIFGFVGAVTWGYNWWNEATYKSRKAKNDAESRRLGIPTYDDLERMRKEMWK